MLAPGTIIDGKYRVVRLLGEGGMGAVYEGQNLRIDRRIAIKVMHASIARDRDHVARFEREAQAAARIGSSHIVDVFDLGDLPDGERFMIMEYIEGESLMERMRARDRFPAPEVVAIGIQLLEGLAKVHEAGIVHRDLKPANVFLAQTDTGGDFVKILDFGICKVLQDRKQGELSTGVGDLLGTPSYMSPEQLEHGPKKLDARSDLYAVGVILYRALSGRLPYKARNLVELLYQLREGAADRIDQVIEIDPGLAAIVTKATEWDPAARYQTARDFQKALIDWLSTTSRVEQLLTDFLEMPRVERSPKQSAPPRAPSMAPTTASKPTPSKLPPPMPPAKKKPAKEAVGKTTAKNTRATLPDVRGEAVTIPDDGATAIPRSRRNTRKAAPPSEPPIEDVPISIDFDEDAATLPKPERSRRGPHRR